MPFALKNATGPFLITSFHDGCDENVMLRNHHCRIANIKYENPTLYRKFVTSFPAPACSNLYLKKNRKKKNTKLGSNYKCIKSIFMFFSSLIIYFILFYSYNIKMVYETE